jgi:hypothetical protein
VDFRNEVAAVEIHLVERPVDENPALVKQSGDASVEKEARALLNTRKEKFTTDRGFQRKPEIARMHGDPLQESFGTQWFNHTTHAIQLGGHRRS